MRRPRWTTLVAVIAGLVLIVNIMDLLQPSNFTARCNKDIVVTKISNHNPSNSKYNKDFILVSDMNNTVHQWPWPESKKTLELCNKTFWGNPSNMPGVSIIISFHDNENVFSILHTLHAIVKRTPTNLLKEIILIDDHSFKDELKQVLQFHIDNFVQASVRLIRSPVQLGLIRARLKGIRSAKAPVVIVMDSHVEPQHGWLEPLLHEIQKNRKTLATPYLDWMQKFESAWQYRHGACSWKTYIDWTLTFGFQALAPHDTMKHEENPTAPIKCGVTVGTVWAMDKEWFEEVGAFDEGMRLWGGENIDLAVRVWLFGGRVVNVPCSHVAHLESTGGREYRNSWSDTIHTNYKRFAEVWMGDYKKYVYEYLPDVKYLDAGDLTARLEIKHRALYNFTWFMTNVLPELGVPDQGFAWGGLQTLSDTRLPKCLDSMFSFNPGLTLCNGQGIASQGFFWTSEGLLRLPMHVLNVAGSSVINNEYTSYHNTGQAAIWFHVKDGPIIETGGGLCLETLGPFQVRLTQCRNTPEQRWQFKYYSPKYHDMINSRTSNNPAFKEYLNKLDAYKTTINLNIRRKISRQYIRPNKQVFLKRKFPHIDHG